MTLYFKITNLRGNTCWEGSRKHYELDKDSFPRYKGGTQGDICTAYCLHAWNSLKSACHWAATNYDFGRNAKLWLVEGDVIDRSGTKVGMSRMRPVRAFSKLEFKAIMKGYGYKVL